MTNLTTFPTPLLRLILCGGKGLPPAWGPLHHVHTHEDEVYPWDPVSLAASSLPSHLRDDEERIEMWSLPLDADSPWPARLALVAAWMTHRRAAAGAIGATVIKLSASDFLNLNIVTAAPWVSVACQWNTTTGDATCRIRGADGGSAWEIEERKRLSATSAALPTLYQHIQAHPPTVALLLALYDVPEIRAWVEQT